MDVDYESTLKTHIRKLLLHYSLTHLTTNYVTHTRSEVSEVLSECLALVPDEDPTSLALPVEPFEALTRQLRLIDIGSYEEKWKADPDSRDFIKGALQGKACKPATVRCWEVDEKPYYNPYRPMLPILTTRAIRQSPRLGATSSSPFVNSLKNFDSRFVEHINLKPVPDELISEQEISVLERGRLLGIRPNIDKETHSSIISLLEHIPGAHISAKHSIRSLIPFRSSMVSAFLRGEDFPPLISANSPMSPPIFPLQMSGASVPGLETLSDIPTLGLMKEVKVEEEENDLHSAHMLLVDGWNVMAPPPTSQGAASDTPSLDPGSQSSQLEVDELFALTPPQQTSLGKNIKMDEYIIPRSRKPGGGRKNNILDKPGQSLATFLPSLIPPATTSFRSIPPSPSLRKSPPVSLVGLPPSPDSSSAVVQDDLLKKEKSRVSAIEDEAPEHAGLNDLINALCAPVNGQNAEDWVMTERMDEKEALMMEVPKLAEPNQHPPSPSCFPTSLRSLIVSKTNVLDTAPATAYLKKVTGVQSLNIELSWRPFNFGTSMPQTEQLADVERYPSLDLNNDTDDDCAMEAELKKLVNELEFPGFDPHARSETRFLGDPPVDWTPIVGDEWNKFDVVLTRAERRRLFGAEDGKFDDSRNTIPHEEVVGHFDPGLGEEPLLSGSPTRPRKRRKLALPITTQTSDFSMPGALEGFRGIPEADDDELSLHAMPAPTRTQLNHPLSGHEVVWNTDAADTEIPVSQPQQYGTRAPSMHIPGSSRQGTSVGQVVSDTEPPRSETRESLCFHESDAAAGRTPNKAYSAIVEDLPMQLARPLAQSPLDSSRDISVTRAPPTSKSHRSEKASAQHALLDFMRSREKSFHSPSVMCSSSPESQPEVLMDMPPSPPRAIPHELMDANTLNIHEDWIPPFSRHRYIASLELIQKIVLARHLTSEDCNIELIERDASAMKGVDLIIDVNTALLFVPLAPLPAGGDKLADRLAELSWDFTLLVVVFEAFSGSLAYRADRTKGGTGLTPYAFSPAVIKAIRRLKRTVKILEATETGNNKCRDTQIQYAYAMDVGEAARLARFVGDLSRSGSGELQESEHEWLTDDFHEDEMDLARITGMNAFAASMILSCTELNTFIEMDPGTRLQLFSEMVGERRISCFNEEMAKRFAQVACLSPLPMSPRAESAISPLAPNIESFEHAAQHDSGYAEAERDHGYYSPYHGEPYQEAARQWRTTGLLMVSRDGEDAIGDQHVP